MISCLKFCLNPANETSGYGVSSNNQKEDAIVIEQPTHTQFLNVSNSTEKLKLSNSDLRITHTNFCKDINDSRDKLNNLLSKIATSREEEDLLDAKIYAKRETLVHISSLVENLMEKKQLLEPKKGKLKFKKNPIKYAGHKIHKTISKISI